MTPIFQIKYGLSNIEEEIKDNGNELDGR